jgi:hypothetical protein
LSAEVGYTPGEAAATGVSAVSHDIGGHNDTTGLAGSETYTSNGQTYRTFKLPDDLYARWVQLGTFQPVDRLHSNHSDRLPWQYGANAQASAEKFLNLREKLVAYTYTLAQQASTTGVPVTRPTYLEYPDEPNAYTTAGSEYFYGHDLLVAPVTTPGTTATTSVWFPPGQWTDYFIGEDLRGRHHAVRHHGPRRDAGIRPGRRHRPRADRQRRERRAEPARQADLYGGRRCPGVLHAVRGQRHDHQLPAARDHDVPLHREWLGEYEPAGRVRTTDQSRPTAATPSMPRHLGRFEMTTAIDRGGRFTPMLRCETNQTHLYTTLVLALRDMRDANGRDPTTGAGDGNASWIGVERGHDRARHPLRYR